MTMPRVRDFDYVAGKKYDSMMGRCYRESDRSFKHYNRLGIKVCTVWIKDVNVFRQWFREQLQKQDIPEHLFIAHPGSYQLDRKAGGSSHYTPDNCQFLSAQANARNKANVRRIFTSAEGDEVEV